jgi:hypothetical protein
LQLFSCSKLLMRWTVLLSDVLIFFPAAWWFVRAYYRGRSKQETAWALAILLLQPASILVDHGHFQVRDRGAFEVGVSACFFEELLELRWGPRL